MQVDPINLTLKAPETERLKLKCCELLSNFAFNSNLRRYSAADEIIDEGHFIGKAYTPNTPLINT